MITSKVTPPAEEEGAEVDGIQGMGGAIDPDHLEHSFTSLSLTLAVFMAHIMWKWLETGKEIEKLRKILVIIEGKMNLSRDVISLYTSRIERIK